VTAAIVWGVIWLVLAVAGYFVGVVVTFHLSLLALAADAKRALLLTIPVGVGVLAFAVFALIQTILQVVSVVQIATA